MKQISSWCLLATSSSLVLVPVMGGRVGYAAVRLRMTLPTWKQPEESSTSACPPDPWDLGWDPSRPGACILFLPTPRKSSVHQRHLHRALLLIGLCLNIKWELTSSPIHSFIDSFGQWFFLIAQIRPHNKISKMTISTWTMSSKVTFSVQCWCGNSPLNPELLHDELYHMLLQQGKDTRGRPWCKPVPGEKQNIYICPK